MVNPAEPSVLDSMMADLFERMRSAEARIAQQERTRHPVVEQATVSAYAGGTQCEVTFDSSVTVTMLIPYGYTPAVGHRVAVIRTPAWSGVLFQIPV